jgi:phage/plasmid-associated DNA primase
VRRRPRAAGTEFTDLYEAWQAWCADSGRASATPKQTFGRDLRAAVPGLRARRGTGQARFYDGIGLLGWRWRVTPASTVALSRTVATASNCTYARARARTRARHTSGCSTELSRQSATVPDSRVRLGGGA